jgi:hypothetical protein
MFIASPPKFSPNAINALMAYFVFLDNKRN